MSSQIISGLIFLDLKGFSCFSQGKFILRKTFSLSKLLKEALRKKNGGLCLD